MKRAVLFALALTIAHAPAALAGESLLDAAVRVADRVVADAPPAPEARPPAPAPSTKTGKARAGRSPAYQAGQPSPGSDAMRPRTKWMIGLGAAAALAGVMLAIDGGVEDNTPSTRGERTNRPF